MPNDSLKQEQISQFRDLPRAPKLRKILGPGVVILATAMGSGEIFFWPGIAAGQGFQLIWLTFAALLFQYVLNTEFIRYTLATGEPIVSGFSQLWKGFNWFFLAAALLPWIWPGWAMGGATALSWLIGGNASWIGAISLVAIGLLLTTSKVVYRALELTQKLLISFVMVVAIGLALAVTSEQSLQAFAQGFVTNPFPLPESLPITTLLAALAFCGAGGTINLAASNWARDKGMGMGQYAKKVISPFSGEVQSKGNDRYLFKTTEANIKNWKAWWKVACREQMLTFLGAGALGLVLFMLIAHSLIAGEGYGVGMGAVAAQAQILDLLYGPTVRVVFSLCVAAIFLTSAVGVLDHASRLSASILSTFQESLSPYLGKWSSESGLYFMTLWSMIGFGLLVLLGLDVSSPPFLLTVAGTLSGIVMFVYSCLIFWLNIHMRSQFEAQNGVADEMNPFDVRFWRQCVLFGAVLLYGAMSIAVVRGIL